MDEYQELATTKNFSLKIRHAGMLKDMEARKGKTASELARIAIEHLYIHLDEIIPDPITVPDAKAAAIQEALRGG